MQLTLYSKPACPLCDELQADLLSMRSQFNFELTVHNIEESPELLARYQYLIPVLDIEDSLVLYPPHTWNRTLAALADVERTSESACQADTEQDR